MDAIRRGDGRRDPRPAQPGEPNYTVFLMGEKPICGAFDMSTPEGLDNVPAHWLTYLAVDDVDESCRQITASGGKVMQKPFDVAMVGRIAVIQDPAGAVAGIGTPADCEPEAS